MVKTRRDRMRNDRIQKLPEWRRLRGSLKGETAASVWTRDEEGGESHCMEDAERVEQKTQ